MANSGGNNESVCNVDMANNEFLDTYEYVIKSVQGANYELKLEIKVLDVYYTTCSCRLVVTPTMRLYLSRVEARLRGITAWWFCRKKGHLHTIPCNEQEWDKELAYNSHYTQVLK